MPALTRPSRPSSRRFSTLRKLVTGCALGLVCTALVASPKAQADENENASAAFEAGEEEEIGTWRFKHADKPVKVLILAGSVGAWQKDPYPEHIQNMCANVEVKNLSKTGYGAYQLRQRFMAQVVKNGYINLRKEGYEHWLVFQGGLNSIATPERTNRELRQMFLSAHKRGMKVVAFTPMPWGAESDKRWRGYSGLKYKDFTETVKEFILGSATPQRALGVYRDRRDDPTGPWLPEEIADVPINLYDSDMRDKTATPRDVEKMKALLAKDKDWKKSVAELSEDERAAKLEADAQAAALIPQYFMRQELHAFDHIHPNEDGHRLIAETACPELPRSWGCDCP